MLTPLNLEQAANDMVHPATKETITKSNKLIIGPATREVSMEAMTEELGQLAQGYRDTKGANTVEFVNLDTIAGLSKGKIVMYVCIIVEFDHRKRLK